MCGSHPTTARATHTFVVLWWQLYPIFGKFENWCQDENRHGDFFSALLKAQPQFLNDWTSKLWARFFCLSVSVASSVIL